jgi:3-O-alpha-D-mannopyranosyl-alpha-D-mannopyranose xylosylphosphotransferase
MFARELSESATRPFRESRKGFADVEMAWLVTHLQIERWREALLWTWAVAKVGDLEGNWGPEARDELRKVLGLSKGAEKGQSTTASTLKDHRDTLKDFEYVSAQGSWEMPTATDLRHSEYCSGIRVEWPELTFAASFDGHMAYAPYSEDEWRFKHQLEKKPKKGVKARPVPDPTCTFNVDECLPEGFWDDETISSADMFTHFAFKKPACGDCLIDTLVTASGSRGLKAFLPSKDKVFTPPSSRTPQMWDRAEPMLPLTGTWQEADFTLANNVRLGQDEWTRVHAQSDKKEGEVNLLDWSVKLLSRYAYVYCKSLVLASKVWFKNTDSDQPAPRRASPWSTRRSSSTT